MKSRKFCASTRQGGDRIRLYLALAILFLAEITVFNRLRIHGARPELLLVCTIFFGFHFRITKAAEAGILSGLLKDIFSAGRFGVNTASFLFVGLLSGYLRGKVFKDNFITQVLFSCVSVYVISSVYIWSAPQAIAENSDFYSQFWNMVLFKSLYTGFLAPLLFAAFTKYFEPKEE